MQQARWIGRADPWRETFEYTGRYRFTISDVQQVHSTSSYQQTLLSPDNCLDVAFVASDYISICRKRIACLTTTGPMSQSSTCPIPTRRPSRCQLPFPRFGSEAVIAADAAASTDSAALFSAKELKKSPIMSSHIDLDLPIASLSSLSSSGHV